MGDVDENVLFCVGNNKITIGDIKTMLNTEYAHNTIKKVDKEKKIITYEFREINSETKPFDDERRLLLYAQCSPKYNIIINFGPFEDNLIHGMVQRKKLDTFDSFTLTKKDDKYLFVKYSFSDLVMDFKYDDNGKITSVLCEAASGYYDNSFCLKYNGIVNGREKAIVPLIIKDGIIFPSNSSRLFLIDCETEEVERLEYGKAEEIIKEFNKEKFVV